MKAITSLTALVLGASLAGMAWAQTETTPPADAGAGAAAAVSGDTAAEAPAGAAADPAAEPTDTAAAGAHVLPNGQDMTAVTEVDGRWRNAEDIPTFKVEDGVVDFATFNGFRRYHAECHVCHGPDGEGSTYAPALKESVLRMDYYDFMQVVASGRQGSNSVMPAFGTNKNVWCYIDDIYVYLLAHGTDTIGRGRPAERADKSEDYTAQEDSCMSS
ncbi:c-type cytochrome, methanol metabolism-related [Paracoccus sp. PAMC 22219]|uniref:c-type cytochrome, methanol metabolism-related n=1 Tax=Paracoccus sp. PAMC 22219 TaxID=1569209 RepID=UPI0005A5D0F8|nr:c-type cytochrome, methanol metabolism-related [Paracoccus sp. PAMC 22219]